jgi:hypothetical protein
VTVSEPQDLPNPIEDDMLIHILGHFIFGVIVGLASISLRYIILSGILPVVLDFDHFIYFANIHAVERAAHSVFFANIIIIVMMIVGKNDYRLWAVAFSAVFSHIAFDIFRNVTYFPLFIPFNSSYIRFNQSDWIFFEIGMFCVIGLVTIITKHTIRNKTQTI